jgi:hypothetical protein
VNPVRLVLVQFEMHAESHFLQFVKWDLFCTLTLPTHLVSAGDGRLGSVVFAWLRRVAAVRSVHFKRLLWCLRSEKGELTGRLHFHCLLGGLGSCSIRDRFAMKNEWESITGAMSRVHSYDASSPGVGYVLKGGVAYEAGKFASAADRVTLSLSLAPTLGPVLRRAS